MLNLEITPKPQTLHALMRVTRGEALHNVGNFKNLTKKRHEVSLPGTNAKLHIVEYKAGTKTRKAPPAYGCVANVAAYLIGRGALCQNVVNKAAILQLELFKEGLRRVIPGASDEALDDIDGDDCRLREVRVFTYFRYPTEKDALEAFFNIHRHCSTMMDSIGSVPARVVKWKTPSRRVKPGPHRHSFEVQLPFGAALVQLRRDREQFPETLLRVSDRAGRERVIAALRCLLCFAIDVDLSRFAGYGASKKLPSDFRHWTRTHMRDDPFEAVWGAFLREVRLSMQWADAASLIKSDEISWQLKEVLQAYFAGSEIAFHEHVGGHGKTFSALREKLIKKARIDIAVPWAAHQLNLSHSLGADFTYGARFNPADDPSLASYTLSASNIDAAVRDAELRTRLSGRIG